MSMIVPMILDSSTTSYVLSYKGPAQPTECARFVQYGITVSFWGSGTPSKPCVIYVENYPQRNDVSGRMIITSSGVGDVN